MQTQKQSPLRIQRTLRSWPGLALATFLTVAWPLLSQTILVEDSFNAATGNTTDLNVDIGRQTGTLAPVTYTMAVGPGHYGHQLQNVNAIDQLLVADFPNSTSSLNYNFNGDRSDGGLRISFDVDSIPTVYGGGADNWGCVNLGMSQANQLVNVNGGETHFGILFRGQGTIQAFDGSAVVSGAVEPVYSTRPPGSYNHIDLVITGADGNPFDGSGDTKIEVFANGGATPVYTYTKVGGFANNYINIQGSFRAHFDNFRVTQLPPPPLPSIVNASFETDRFLTFPGYTSQVGNGPITGWNAPGGAGINPAAGSPFADNGAIPDGTQVAFIQEDNGTLSQVVTGFLIGRTYQIRYFENARNCCSGTVPFLQASIAGQVIVAAHGVTPVGGSNPYHEVVSDPFVASATSLELAFTKTNPQGGDTTVVIDKVGFLAAGTPPTITVQPQSKVAGLGQTVIFSVGATGSAPLSYQWYFGANPIAGANGPTLSFVANARSQAGEYSVRVSNSAGSVTSQTFTLELRALVPGLFNTGVDGSGVALTDNSVDPHYQLVVNADSASLDAIVQDSTVFPIVTGPWLANNAGSKWIGPRFNTAEAAGLATGNGTYLYRISFDLTGLDISSVVITGGWAIDNLGLRILVNGQPTGLSNGSGFGGLTAFTISALNATFVQGLNTLEFEVQNSDAVSGYTGLRVDNLLGLATLPGTPPAIQVQPQGGLVGTGETVELTVVATGSSPLSYVWTKNGVTVPGANGPVLTLANITRNDAGDYVVTVSNAAGNAVSATAQLAVLDSVPGMFNTGVDDSKTVLADNEIDPHYKIVLNPDSTSANAIVQNSTVFPIVDGTWLRNNTLSKWIGPRLETSAAAGGDYVYRLTFDLTGFQPGSVAITGNWSSDNSGLDILINGVSTGNTTDGNFGAFTPFIVQTGFIPGLNTLDFKLNNAAAGYTGLRVQGIRGLGDALPPGTPPVILEHPQSITRVVSQTATFTVRANGSAPVNYQWFYGPDAIPGATGPTLSFFIDFPDVGGDYSVRVSNPFGSVQSNPAVLTVSELPEITRQPQSQLAAVGDTVTFDVAVDAFPPLFYQWFKNDVEIPGATLATFTLTSVTEADAGSYGVRVSNFAGSVDSVGAVLTIAQRVPGVFNTGVDDAGVSLASGTIDPHYKLIQSADTAFPGPNALVLNDSGFPIPPWLANDEASKWIAPQANQGVGNNLGDYTYRTTFDLTGFDPASIRITGNWATDNLGLDILINGISTGQPNTGQFVLYTPFTISSGFRPGLNTLDFKLNNATPGINPTGLRVAAIKGTGLALPDGTVPFIITQPASVEGQLGQTFTFIVEANGSAPLTYQWFFGTSPIPGETNPSLSVHADFPDVAGSYHVEVRNAFGSVVSQTATLRLPNPNQPPTFTKGPDVSASEDEGPKSIAGWAANINPGDVDEGSQVLTFLVSNDQPGLFSVQPAIDATGRLTFNSAPNAFGIAQVTVVLRDNGGTEDGGQDTSAPQTFSIGIVSVNDAPTCTGASASTDQGVPVDIALSGSDIDSSILSFVVAGPASHGSVTIVGALATYTPNAGYFGPDTFLVAARDGEGALSQGCAVAVTVRQSNATPVAVIEVSPLVDLGAGVSGLNAIAADNETACLLFDGSASSDADNPASSLTFAWLVDGQPAAAGAVAEICLETGTHQITLLVSDGQATGQTTVEVNVLTAGEAVEELVLLVNDSVVARSNKRPFLASLKAASASFDRESFGSGVNQLRAFQNKVRAQVRKSNPDLAEEWIRVAQEIIDAMGG